MICADVRSLSTEFALGLLDGRPRAEVVDHLRGCAQCRSRVDADLAALDLLLAAGPRAEPPAGFEGRVLAEIGREVGPAPSILSVPGHGALRATGPRRRRRRLSLVSRRAAVGFGAVAASLLLLVAGILIGGRHRTSASQVRAAAMVTAEGRTVGQAVVAARSDTLVVAVPDWSPTGWQPGEVYRMRITMADGTTRTVVPSRLRDGVWAAALPVDGARVRGVAMLDGRGWVVCQAHLSA